MFGIRDHLPAIPNVPLKQSIPGVGAHLHTLGITGGFATRPQVITEAWNTPPQVITF